MLSFIVHANIAFSASENWYFREFLNELRPSYESPSRFVLSHSIMDSEAARVQLEELHRLSKRSRLTLLYNGWDDRIGRSLYGAVASEVNQYPVVLSLDDMTGHRGSADMLLKTSQKALKNMDMDDGRKLIALTTDNPTVMQAYRRKFQASYYWILVRYYLPSRQWNCDIDMLIDLRMFSPWVKHHNWRDRCISGDEENHYEEYENYHFL
jgi:hypothetical protein